jgi:hypothetical protein
VSAVSPFARVRLMLLCLPIAGCAPQLWAKPGGTANEFEGAKAGCNAQSYAMFPPAYQQVMVSPGYFMPLQTNCTPYGECFTSGGYYVQPTYVPVDMNDRGRSSAFRSCLMTAGWVPVKDKEEATLVTNSAPQRPGASGPDGVRSECGAAAGEKAAGNSSLFSKAFNACMQEHGS